MSSKINSYLCAYQNCSKLYPNKYSLLRHIEIKHNKSRRFKCNTCKKTLSSKQALSEHSFIHTNLKPYKCTEEFCGKSFRQKSLLSSHLRFHRKIKFSIQPDLEFVELKVWTMQLTKILPKDFLEDKIEGNLEIKFNQVQEEIDRLLD